MKAILVIDMPECCAKCPCYHEGYGHCSVNFKFVEDETQIPLWCPLKPIHALKSAGKDYIIYERQYLYENLEREYELMKEVREFDESNISS